MNFDSKTHTYVQLKIQITYRNYERRKKIAMLSNTPFSVQPFLTEIHVDLTKLHMTCKLVGLLEFHSIIARIIKSISESIVSISHVEK